MGSDTRWRHPTRCVSRNRSFTGYTARGPHDVLEPVPKLRSNASCPNTASPDGFRDRMRGTHGNTIGYARVLTRACADGRPAVMIPDRLRLAHTMRMEGATLRDIAEALGVSNTALSCHLVDEPQLGRAHGRG